MSLRLQELHRKDVIQQKTGENLGCIDDIVFSQDTAKIESVVLYGRRRLFGLLGRDDDLVIPWEKLKSIGADVVMVDAEVPPPAPRHARTGFL